MTIASDLARRHFETLVDDNAHWQTLISDHLLWELVYAPSIGHPAQLSGRDEVMRHVTWLLKTVEHFRFFDLRVSPFADPEAAVAEVKAEAVIKPTGRTYRQEYVLFLWARDGKIVHLREYFDPVRAARAMDTPILGLETSLQAATGRDAVAQDRQEGVGVSPTLPAPVAAYFAASNRHDIDAMLAPFSATAIVTDEGRRRSGLAAVREWIEETTTKYRHTATISAVDQEAGDTIVTARVSGAFPGSPVDIRYSFTLNDQKIARLNIR